MNHMCQGLRNLHAHISFGLLYWSIAWVCINNWSAAQPVGKVAHCDPQSTRPRAYNGFMKTNNPYVQQILSKGRDYVPTPAKMGEFPKTIHGRVFNTEDEYREAIADFLNGL